MTDDGILLAVAILTGHACFWALVIGRIVASRQQASDEAPTVTGASARASRVLNFAVGAYVGFYVLGLAWLVHAPLAGPELWEPTSVTTAAGAALGIASLGVAAWSLIVFRSWRVRAEVDSDHELMTDGPFRLVRHPIYAAIIGLYAASFVLVPRAGILVALLAMASSHDLRARAEEEALLQAFGVHYERYMRRTRRLLPGVY